MLPTALLAQAADPPPSLRFGVIGDSGSGTEDQLAVARQMKIFEAEHPWEFVLMLGDNIYEEGDPDDFGPKFKDVYHDLMQKGVAFHATLGNHDRVHPASRKGWAQVEDPVFGYVGKQDEYVLEAGPRLPDERRLARFVCLNSEAWIDAISAKRHDEVERRLTQLRRWLGNSHRYAWNILYLHHPLYSYLEGGFFRMLGLKGHGPSKELREILEPAITDRDALVAPAAGRPPIKGKMPIDLVLAGHEHFYQKIKPQKGVEYIISGGAGKLRPGVATKHSQVEFGALALHFLNVELTTGELRYQAIGVDGKPIHSGVIYNPSYAPTANAR